MEKLYVEQNLLSEQLSRLRLNYKKDSKSRKTISYLNRLLSKLEDLTKLFAVTHRQILDGLTGKSEDLEHPYFGDCVQMVFEETCMDMQAELEELLVELEGTPTRIEASTIHRRTEGEVRLPRIELPSFSGDYSDWMSFKDLFVSLIYDKESLSNVEKLHYLKCSLQGEPSDLLKSYKITANNFELAWKTLLERYDNRSALINIQFKQLCNNEAISESAESLKGLLDKTMESVRLIENMEVHNLWHALVVYLVVQRLPIQTRTLWEQEQATKNEFLSLTELQRFLTTRFRTLEATGVQTPVRRINAHHVGSQLECSVCKQAHKLRSCPQFVNATQGQRFDMVKRNRLCINCLSKGHMASNCPNSTKCFKCQGTHHTMLHREVNTTIEPRSQQPVPSTSAQPFVPSNVSNINSLSGITTGNVLLATAIVTMNGENGIVGLRALLDQGSQASFMTEDAVQRLGLKRKICNVLVSGIGKTTSIRSRGLVEGSIQTSHNELIAFEAFVLTKLTNVLPAQCVQLPPHSELVGIQLADPQFNIPGRIDMILGADIYGRLMMKDSKLLFGGLLLQQTKLGWILSGTTHHAEDPLIHSFKVEITQEESLDNLLEKFWKLEEPNAKKILSVNDQRCEDIYKNSTYREETGRFVVRLPFKNEKIKNELGGSRRSAELSLLGLERRFARNPDLKAEYVNCIQEFIRMGYLTPEKGIEELTSGDGGTRCHAHYLPHHAVKKDSTTTKTRIVFDASRKTTSGLSLNDALLTGPSIQNCMISVITRWRLHKFAFAADIAKMYLQIQLHKEDRDYQRILWRFEPQDEIQEYRFNTVTFGVTSAPFLAIRTLKQLAKEGKSKWPRAAKAIEYDFYVDDLLSGAGNQEEAMLNILELRELLDSGGFHLRKWISNDPLLIQDIPAEDIEPINVLDLDFDQGHKSLGIIWHPGSDSISYRYNIPDDGNLHTKRSVLSDIARLYDPLGWIAPMIVNAKCLMKTLWKLGFDWDERLPANIIDMWKKIKISFAAIERIRIPRWISMDGDGILELHGFCDASLEAYGAAIYCVSRVAYGSTARLVLAKAKVSPVKPETIPRLELCGAVLVAQLMRQYLNSVREHANIKHIHLWTDSEIVMAWLSKHPSEWSVFVSNRSCQILDLVPDIPWKYVPSKLNPADIASRGVDSEHLINNRLWWNGPDWLSQSEDQWPVQGNIKPTTLEAKRDRVMKCHNASIAVSDLDILINKFSSLTRLVRVTAYCRRFCQIVSKRVTNRGYLTVIELNEALMFWIAYIQRSEFAEEIDLVENKIPLKKGNRIAKLNPFVDGNGILRVGGRLTHANMPFNERHPVILPKSGKLTELVIDQTHKMTMHGGTQLMLAVLGTKYWILDARNLVKNYIYYCVKCYRMKAQTSSQLMGSLPAPRVNIARPFTHVGVDYCGPINIKDRKGRGGQIHKGYFAIFVCLAVKAIHIEVVNDLSTDAFLAAFRRFVSRRGLCSDIYSDCGTNFVGANAELRRIVSANRRISKDVADQGIVWHFNPPASPHFGGLWEAGVKSMKMHLRKTIGDAVLTYEELCTTVAQIEACLNSRPLCPMYDDPNDSSALTPAHFIIGDTLLNVPEPNLLDLKLSNLSRWQLTQRLAQMFWERWSKEYLMRLQQRPKWLTIKQNPQIGDLCLLKDERLPSYKWPLARISALHPGKDNLVRVVSLIKNGNTFQRNVTKIALLPTSK